MGRKQQELKERKGERQRVKVVKEKIIKNNKIW